MESGVATDGGGSAFSADPMHQFVVRKIVPWEIAGVDASFTNASLFMVIVAAAVTLFLAMGASRRALVPGRLQSMAELSYEFVANMIRDTAGKEGMRFFPFVFTLFMFILFSNVIGMVPYSFTVTSHIIVTLAFALVVFLGVTVLGFVTHGIKFLNFFVPHGVPKVLLPFIIVIEIISYLSRPMSLSVRLFANMMAGHTMLAVFGGFVVMLGVVAGWIPLLFSSALMGLEFLVAFLQAYVFAVLTCIYLNDALHMHH